MSDEPKEPQGDESKPIDWQRVQDDFLVSRAQHFEALAKRILSHDGTRSYNDADMRHLAEMMFLLETAMEGKGFHRFRSRYAGSY